MIKGTGVDILEISRIAEMSQKMGWTLAHRVLGPAELEVYAGIDGRYTQTQYLARRFAAKEAIIKAIGGDKPLDMRDYQVLNEPNGRPYVLHAGARVDKLHVSISDSNEHVVAQVVYEA